MTESQPFSRRITKWQHRKLKCSCQPQAAAAASGAGQFPLNDRASKLIQIDALPIVRYKNLQHSGLVACFEVNSPLRGLAGGTSLIWKPDAMIDGIAQQVVQRGIKFFQNISINLRCIAH
jgi:hypothetical protein